MNVGIEEALDKGQELYDCLIEIANEMVGSYTEPIDKLINDVKDRIEDITNDEIRVVISKLSLFAWSFGEVKEKSAFKATAQKLIKDEEYAKAFIKIEGAQETKKQQATLNISDENAANLLCELVSNLLKTKLDEIHRIVATFTTVLMTRLSEAKLSVTTLE